MTSYPSEKCQECGNDVFFSSCSGVNGHYVGHDKNCSQLDEVDSSC